MMVGPTVVIVVVCRWLSFSRYDTQVLFFSLKPKPVPVTNYSLLFSFHFLPSVVYVPMAKKMLERLHFVLGSCVGKGTQDSYRFVARKSKPQIRQLSFQLLLLLLLLLIFIIITISTYIPPQTRVRCDSMYSYMTATWSCTECLKISVISHVSQHFIPQTKFLAAPLPPHYSRNDDGGIYSLRKHKQV